MHTWQGRTQRLKKGGAGTQISSMVDAAVRRAQRAEFFCEHIMHSVLGRSGGMLLYKFRRYESASEAVGDHHNHAKCLTTGV